MATDGMTLDQAIRWWGSLYRLDRSEWPSQLQALRKADVDRAIAALRSEPPSGDAQRALLTEAFRFHRESHAPSGAKQNLRKADARAAHRQVMEAFRVSERAAYRLLEKHAVRQSNRYVIDTATWARISHDMTTKALREVIVQSRQPHTTREYRSAQEYARRRVPPIRGQVLTGMALEQAVLSIEAADPGLVTREHRGRNA